MKKVFENIINVIKNSRKKKYFVITFTIFFLLFVYFYIFYKLPTPYSLKNYNVVPLTTHILDRNGKVLYKIYKDQKRTPIKLSALPDYVSQATIAIEDKDFFNHKGISLIGGIVRAIKENVTTGQLQGGSTITQQLV
ncbi:MAG: transglycosylase domain-containing protein, partial [bacterium]